MNITIRKATVQDAEGISKIWEIICSERGHSAVSKPFTITQERAYISSLSEDEAMFVAKISDRIMGFQSIDKWEKYTDSFDHVGVLGTFIIPKYRSKKVGILLSEHTFKFAREHGYEKLVIYVRANNLGAQGFYKKLGFVEKGRLSKQVKIDNQYFDEVFMELFL